MKKDKKDTKTMVIIPHVSAPSPCIQDGAQISAWAKHGGGGDGVRHEGKDSG